MKQFATAFGPFKIFLQHDAAGFSLGCVHMPTLIAAIAAREAAQQAQGVQAPTLPGFPVTAAPVDVGAVFARLEPADQHFFAEHASPVMQQALAQVLDNMALASTRH